MNHLTASYSGIIIYYIFVLFLVFVIKYGSKNASYRLIAFVSFAFGFLAFIQVPSELSDLQPAFEHIRNIKQAGWNYFLDENYVTQVYFAGKPTLQAYFYLISRLPYLNFYSAIAEFCTYFMCLSSIKMAADYYEGTVDQKKNMYILFIFMFDFYGASNGVRNFFAFSIFVCFFAMEIFKGKKIIPYIMYAVAVGLHPAVGILVAIRLIMLMNNNYIKVIAFTLLIFWGRFIDVIVTLLGNFTANDFIFQLHERLIVYSTIKGETFNFDENVFNLSASYIQMITYRVIVMLVVLIMIYKIWNNQRKLSEDATMCLYLSGFCLGATIDSLATNIISRYALALIMLMPMVSFHYSYLSIRKKTVLLGRLSGEMLHSLIVVCMILMNINMALNNFIVFHVAFELYA